MTASRNDPCSNSLIEALSCGLPAIYLKSGGHPELVGEAGLGFEKAEDVPGLLDQVSESIEEFQKRIRVPSIGDVAERYLSAWGLGLELVR